MNKDLTWVLSQIGFLAAFSGQSKEALQIFEGMDAMYQDNPGIKNGLGMAYLLAGQFKQSIAVYREDVLIAEPQNYEARCFLGMALWETGEREEARKLLEDAYANGDDDVKEISESCLKTMNIDVNAKVEPNETNEGEDNSDLSSAMTT